MYFEAAEETARWENVAMAYGRAFGGGGINALFTPMFWVATLLNFVPAMLSGPMAIDWAVVGAVHGLFACGCGPPGSTRAVSAPSTWTVLEAQRRIRQLRITPGPDGLPNPVDGVDQPQFRPRLQTGHTNPPLHDLSGLQHLALKVPGKNPQSTGGVTRIADHLDDHVRRRRLGQLTCRVPQQDFIHPFNRVARPS